MTRDEHRTECIDVMIDARLEFYKTTVGFELPTNEALQLYKEMERKLMTAAFDSLHGVATVDPVEATREMLDAAHMRGGYAKLYAAMAAAGDLTNPPEQKP